MTTSFRYPPYCWSDEDCLLIALIRCVDAAEVWAQSRQFATWSDFARQFLLRFGQSQEVALQQLENCWQEDGETAKSFADRFMAMAKRAGRRHDSALLYQFIRRLLPELRLEVSRQRPQTMADAVDAADYWSGFINSTLDSYMPFRIHT